MNKKFVQEFTITDEGVGSRLDLFVSKKINISRSQAQKMIKEELVLIGEKSSKPNFSVSTGDKVRIFEEIKTDMDESTIPVLFEDNDILVINKPSGISAHPASGEKSKTVSEYFSMKLDFTEKSDRNGIVHRLDKGTSGVMVLAKNEKAQAYLKNEFKDRRVKKKYLVLVEGGIEPKEGIIDLPVERHPVARERMSVSAEGRPAVTEYSVLDYYDKFSYLEAFPKTGRTHQIRVHFQAIGHPVVGDLKYGHKSELISRIFLHATELEFIHPVTKKKVVFSAETPSELKNALEKLN